MNYISVFSLNVPSYSIIIIIGLIVSNIMAIKVLKKKELNTDDFVLLETYSLAFAMLGAKVLYLLVMRENIDWSRVLDWNYIKPFIQGGFVFYGGLIGMFFGIYLLKKIHNVDVKSYLAEVIFCIPIAHGFGRVGCYLAGCCYGVPYDGPFYVEYRDIPYTLCNVKLFPVQLVEAVFLFIFAFIFYYVVNKGKASFNLLFYYLISYSVLRFILEFFRYDTQRGNFMVLSTSQWISIGLFILSIIYLVYNKKNRNG